MDRINNNCNYSRITAGQTQKAVIFVSSRLLRANVPINMVIMSGHYLMILARLTNGSELRRQDLTSNPFLSEKIKISIKIMNDNNRNLEP